MSTSTIVEFLVNFSIAFSSPSFENFTSLALGWIICTGRHSISRVIQFAPHGTDRSHCSFYRFFSRAKWEPDELSLHLIPMVVKLIPRSQGIYLSIDDTLCHRSGAHIWGAGMHFDPLRSNYGRGNNKRTRVMAFGHSWVIASLLVPLPWTLTGRLAVPVAFRLYRSKKTCPKTDYKKRTELAVETIKLLLGLLPFDRKIIVLGDDEYACRTVAQGIEDYKISLAESTWKIQRNIELCGPMSMKAAFYQPKPPYTGRGRPKKKGARLPSPRKLAEDDSLPWETKKMPIYCRKVEIQVKTQVGWWYSVTGPRPVRMVVTRDPRGRIDDRAYFCTDSQMTVEQVITSYSYRWTQEVLHRNLKQYLGVDDPQNGWWRHPHGQRRNDRQPGPAAHETRGARAVRRTVPFILTVYAVIVLWYLRHGDPLGDVARVLLRAPWNKRKGEVCFADMLSAARRELLRPLLFAGPKESRGFDETTERLRELLIAA